VEPAREDGPVAAPDSPSRKLVLWVQPAKYGGRRCGVGVEYRVLQATLRYFTAEERPFGEEDRARLLKRPRGEWTQWLRSISDQKDVFLNGRRMVPPGPGPGHGRVDPRARDLRMERAVSQVAGGYDITPYLTGVEGELGFRVSRGEGHQYWVTARSDWSRPPTCTCPDAARSVALAAGRGDAGSAGWCKHVMAVLMGRQELRGQLLDLYI